MLLVDHGLGVIALDPPLRDLLQARIGIGRVDRPLRCLRWRVGLGARTHPPALGIAPERAMALEGGIGAPLDHQLLFQPPLGFFEPLRPRTGDRARLLVALLIELAQSVAQPPTPASPRRDLRRQLVATRLSVELILSGVGLPGLLDDLAGDLLVVHHRVPVGVCSDLRPIDRDDPGPRQPRLRAQSEHRSEQPPEHFLVPLDKRAIVA